VLHFVKINNSSVISKSVVEKVELVFRQIRFFYRAVFSTPLSGTSWQHVLPMRLAILLPSQLVQKSQLRPAGQTELVPPPMLPKFLRLSFPFRFLRFPFSTFSLFCSAPFHFLLGFNPASFLLLKLLAGDDAFPPDADGIVKALIPPACTCQIPTVGGEGDGTDRISMPHQCLDMPEAANLIDADGVVIASTC